MSDAGTCRRIYKGSKLFWRTRNSVDITIVQHPGCSLTEIIVYEPSINVEAKRIYLNSGVLRTKLDQAEIDSTFTFTKQNDVSISVETITNHAISEFILSRLIIAEFKREEYRFEVALQFRQSDSNSHINELICAAVADLQPYETETKKSNLLVPGLVEATLQALEEDKRSLVANRHQAALLEAKARALLSGKQRWRIPIVLIKMDKGKVLSAGDAKIWEAVSSNLKTQTDIERVAEITTETATTEKQMAAKKAFKGVQLSARTPGHAPPAISRANSSRHLAGTATSQSRTHVAAQDKILESPMLMANSKQNIKRSSSNRALHGKGLHRTKSRLAPSRQNSATNLDTSADQEPEHPDALPVDISESLHPISDKMRASFASQVTASLTSFVNSISSKFMPSIASLKDVSDTKPTNPHVSFSMIANAPTDQELDAEVLACLCPQSDLLPPSILQEPLSLSLMINEPCAADSEHASSSDESVVAGPVPPPNATLTDCTAERDADTSAVNKNLLSKHNTSEIFTISTKNRTAFKKRSSFSKTLLAMLAMLAWEEGESFQVGASAHSPHLQPVRKDTFDASDELLMQDGVPRSNKPSGVSSWLPWRRGSSSSAKIVPVNLAEYTRAQYVE